MNPAGETPVMVEESGPTIWWSLSDRRVSRGRPFTDLPLLACDPANARKCGAWWRGSTWKFDREVTRIRSTRRYSRRYAAKAVG